MSATPKTIQRHDYRPFPYTIETVELRFELEPQATRVASRLIISRREGEPGDAPLELNGEGLALKALRLDGIEREEGGYQMADGLLTLTDLPARFVLEVETEIDPDGNSALEGLYRSSGNFCTQCEAEGFRKITFYPDRPDVMSRFTTTLVADPVTYPVLLANGNRIDHGTLDDGRHYATWEDPFAKPCYLFALVAGDLARVADSFTTRSGREVALEIYVQHGNENKADHAMASLQRAMRWDEEVYGREYDLDIYMIVAVDDFNMGAMENKGLNVFNSRYVLARPESATDSDFVAIEGVIAHEYFHNWSGNRVTCRDWFQLSLKEGFTVFRDQQFTADMQSAAVKRIDDVGLLRARQFAEDAGPMAHPIRPDAYVEINNFYTLTVYEKGAEVVRMLHTLLGGEGFRRGSDLYFERHDGEAATCDDFVAAMADANAIDLGLFQRWYSQAGTPEVSAHGDYDADTKRYTLTLRQQTPPTHGQPEKLPLQIPVRMALLDSLGQEMALQLEAESEGAMTERVLSFHQAEQQFVFTGVMERPLPSLLRGFSAPVKLTVDYSDTELAFLLAHDGDPFNRWEAGQQLGRRVIERLLETGQNSWQLDAGLLDAFGKTIADVRLDDASRAELLTLPAESYLAEFQQVVEPEQIHAAREFVRRELARALRSPIEACYRSLNMAEPYRIDAEAIGRRRLKNLLLNYLLALGDSALEALAVEQYQQADNMTDSMAALAALVQAAAPAADALLEGFYRKWQADPLVVDKWFALQAGSLHEETLARVMALFGHPAFTLKNPNRVRSLVGVFAMNPVAFHADGGTGYRLLSDKIIALNGSNPQIAARLLTPLTRWRRFNENRQQQMRTELERILAVDRLAPDLFEVVSRSLAD